MDFTPEDPEWNVKHYLTPLFSVWTLAGQSQASHIAEHKEKHFALSATPSLFHFCVLNTDVSVQKPPFKNTKAR